MSKMIRKPKKQPEAAPPAGKSFVGTLIRTVPAWATRRQEGDDIIMSTRIRLARNLDGVAFPMSAGTDTLAGVLSRTQEACSDIKLLGDVGYVEMGPLDEMSAKVLVERRLISPAFISTEHPRLAIVDPAECISIMVNEEDHLRIQSMQPGLALQEAWRLISRLDDELSEKVDYAFSPEFGYLTSCPTNTGTGMRASIQAHLPALALSEQVDQIVKDLAPSEIVVRGFYGEGTDVMGNIFQISNQLTLGRTEIAIVNRLEIVAQKFLESEREARETLYEKRRVFLEDKIFRALAILRNARIISSQEFLNQLSLVRLGMDLGMIQDLDQRALSELMILTQPAHLQKLFAKTEDAEQRDFLRAEMIRSKLGG